MSKAAPASLARRRRRATKPSTASSARATTNKIRAARLAYDPARKSAIETKARETLNNVIRFGDIKTSCGKSLGVMDGTYRTNRTYRTYGTYKFCKSHKSYKSYWSYRPHKSHPRCPQGDFH